MWIMLNKSFLSIIDPDANYSGGGSKGEVLLVRGRIRGDIEAIFPGARVTETPDRDYRYRAQIMRSDVAAAMQKAVADIDYSNFKGSVKETGRHDAYMDVWTAMHNEQRRRHSPPRRAGRAVSDMFEDAPIGRRRR